MNLKLWICAILVVFLLGIFFGHCEALEDRDSADDSHTSLNGDTKWLASKFDPSVHVLAGPYKKKTYCFPGVPRSIRSLLYSAYFILDIPEGTFQLFRGSSASEVDKQYKSSSRWFALLPWRDRSIRLQPFTPTCLGVYTDKAYTLTLKVLPVDPSRLIMFFAGVALILFGRKMSRNYVFHYSSGISLALIGSLLVIIFLVSRMIPKKAASVGFLVGGWAVVIYFFQTLWKNFRETVLQHGLYVAIYCSAVSLITFFLIYRFGGIQNQKTMDVLQWSLQIVGAILIYFSCNIEVIALAIICLLFALEISIERGFTFRRFRLINKFFPPRPPKLLTQEEFDEIGRRETQKELAKLREFTQSPNCKPWKLVRKLRSPDKFASFIEEGSHLSMDEVDAYEREISFDGDANLSEDETFPTNLSRNGISPSRNAFGQSNFRRNDRWDRDPFTRSDGPFTRSNDPFTRSDGPFANRFPEPMDYE